MRSGERFLAGLFLGAVLLAGCGPTRAPTTVGQLTSPAPAPASASPTQHGATTSGALPTQSPEPFALDLTPLPSPTALPTLELPTQPVLPALPQSWDGLPTYPADSRPGFFFRVQFDPQVWALTFDQFGSSVLGNRAIGQCLITPAAGQGLPMNATVEHNLRRIGNVAYQIDTAWLNGERQFVTYNGGDGVVFTAFKVGFKDQADACLAAAEQVLASLSSVAASEATPPATP